MKKSKKSSQNVWQAASFPLETAKYKTAFMIFVGKEYHRLNWVMQLHYGCKRDNNGLMFKKLGPDTGFDCISNYTPADQLADFLNALVSTDELRKRSCTL